MWSGSLETVKERQHRSYLVPGTVPIRQQPYRGEESSRKLLEKEVDTQLQAGVIGQVQTEWDSPVLLAPK